MIACAFQQYLSRGFFKSIRISKRESYFDFSIEVKTEENTEYCFCLSAGLSGRHGGGGDSGGQSHQLVTEVHVVPAIQGE